jgi:hypothetical protein
MQPGFFGGCELLVESSGTLFCTSLATLQRRMWYLRCALLGGKAMTVDNSNHQAGTEESSVIPFKQFVLPPKLQADREKGLRLMEKLELRRKQQAEQEQQSQGMQIYEKGSSLVDTLLKKRKPSSLNSLLQKLREQTAEKEVR